MSSDAGIWLSAEELSMLGERLVAGLPKTLSGCGRRAKKEGWKSRTVKGSGGPGGMRTEYRPPADVLVQIQAFLDANPDFLKPKRGKAYSQGYVPDKHVAKQPAIQDQDKLMAMARFAEGSEPASGIAIDESLLTACHKACRGAYGDHFDQQPVDVQMGYAVDLYNLLVRMSAQNGGIEQMKRLEIVGILELLKVFNRLGWARKFPPPPYRFSF
jgi:hypothetical protein